MNELVERMHARLDRMAAEDVAGRIWRRDHTVWKPEPREISNRLGWLDAPEAMAEHAAGLRAFAERARADGFTRALLLGMGGSSLAPEVLRTAIGPAPGTLKLSVLDTTHPAAVGAALSAVDPDRTLFLVASKSGETIETLSHLALFWSKVPEGRRFVAITDPGSPLEALARERGFRRIFLNPPDIGGRFSALSLFGLVPAALIGIDVAQMLEGGREAARACGPDVPVAENPGAWLGALVAEAALAGRDKLTLLENPALGSFGAWVEQLVAESTGKEGRGILPVVGESLGPPDVYGDDRIFVGGLPTSVELDELERAGHPVALLGLLASGSSARVLGAEFLRWEIATVVAGHALAVNPFDQPNVAEAKRATAEILDRGAGDPPSPGDAAPLLDSLGPGDYLAIQAFVAPSPESSARLEGARLAIRDRRRVATTLGFGPRYLHSTGQLHKGGPPSGAFLQVVDAARGADLAVPGAPYTFGELIDAQALGDLRALRARGRRVARVTLESLEEVAG
ncbi:MAG: glucose-6-phosphate isomerase [Acidobacteria bacterium]|nr:glucose-6-phosphate isomerase [Acidobacteriota bacterium]